MILRDEQVGGAVVVIVSGDDGTRVFELNLVEADVGSDVFESVRPEVAEEADFALAIFGFAYCNEIDPAVVVVVEGGDTVGFDPAGVRKLDRIKTLAVIVVPQGKCRLASIG